MENSSPSPTSRGSAITLPPNSFNPIWTILAGIGLIFILMVLLLISVTIFFVSHGSDIGALRRAATGSFAIEIQAVIEVVLIAYLAALLPPLAKTSLRGLGFTAPTRSQLTVALLGIPAMIIVTIAVGDLLALLLHVNAQEEAIKVFFNMRSPLQKAEFAAFAIVLAPIAEEMVFRVYLFNAMRSWWAFWPAAVVSCLIFGIVHTQGGGWALTAAIALPLACAGVILCIVYSKSGNAWMSMLTHGSFNAFSLLILTIAPQLAK